MTCHDRAEEESTGRAKAEKENRELHALVQEMQDDLDSEREAKKKSEKLRKQLDEVCKHAKTFKGKLYLPLLPSGTGQTQGYVGRVDKFHPGSN